MAANMNGNATQDGDGKSTNTFSESSEPTPDGLEGLYPTIPGFKGAQHPFSRDAKELKAYSIANTLLAAIRYANEKGLKLSIKSGGHQYSGACSTYMPNIMMDLGSTYPEIIPDKKTSIVKIGVSNALKVLNQKLVDNHLFVPHGQCSCVHIGGHGQTGGYGNLGRSFGLFGDHIRKSRLFDHSATLKEISLDSEEESDRQLFCAILRGSPGNFGVITHYYVQANRDEDYRFKNDKEDVTPQFYRGLHLYRRDILETCLKKVAEMADNPEFERNYDLCISVLSSTSELKFLGPSAGLEEVSDGPPRVNNGDGVVINGVTFYDVTDQEEIDEINVLIQNGTWPAVIVIYAQWVPFSKDDKYDPAWFNYFTSLPKKIPHMPNDNGSFRGGGPMSEITKFWLFA